MADDKFVAQEEGTETVQAPQNPEKPVDWSKLISSFNRHFGSLATVSKVEDENEQKNLCEQCHAEWENARKELYEKKEFLICDGTQAKATMEMLQDWNTNYVAWAGNHYLGVVKFADAIKKLIDDYKDDEDFVVDFPALSWLYLSMQKPAGLGYASAVWFNEQEEKKPEKLTYSEVFGVVKSHMAEVAREDKKIQILQQVWGMAEGGFRLDFKFDINDSEKMLDFFNLVTTAPEYTDEDEETPEEGVDELK